MKAGFYPRLALTGIRKNRQLYIPYLLTCVGMVMMYYIIAFLSATPAMEYMKDGVTLQAIFAFGSGTIAVFSAIFLFYTNSFLIRRRKKEFGLYNILGMGKRNIGRILFWETVMIAGVALTVGLAAGVTFSKLAELGLLNVIGVEVNYRMLVLPGVMKKAVVYFCGIFVLIFLNGLRQIHLANPVALLHSENVGEKPPKGNWFFGLCGVLLLSAAYYLSITIESPLNALSWFFVAVIMVIVGTYLLFIAGSVCFCRLLQRNHKYYYQSNHFVSVSSMVYRMKRNGAGLASICILGTMVLVMLAGSACLYFGVEDSLRTRYPYQLMATAQTDSFADMNEEKMVELHSNLEEKLIQNEIDQENVIEYRVAASIAKRQDNSVILDGEMWDSELDTKGICMMYFVPVSDYNRLMGATEQLESGQVMIYPMRFEYNYDTLEINGKSFHVTKQFDDFISTGDGLAEMFPAMIVVVTDFENSLNELDNLCTRNGQKLLSINWIYGFDTTADAQKQIQAASLMKEALGKLASESDEGICFYDVDSRAEQRTDFFQTYGGMFFLGIMLSIVFILAAVLIIYYKQISEGYEDRSRFEIMQKVGMTEKDIRRSINSQMLTVFSLPLAGAVIHLAFAFPMIRRLLMLFGLMNVKFLIMTAVISVLVFAGLYTLVYRITSNSYYRLVSGAKEN